MATANRRVLLITDNVEASHLSASDLLALLGGDVTLTTFIIVDDIPVYGLDSSGRPAGAEPGAMPLPAPRVLADVAAAAMQMAEAAVPQAKALLGPSVALLRSCGDPAKDVCRLAETAAYDLVILCPCPGKSSRHARERTVRQLLARASCPVMVGAT